MTYRTTPTFMGWMAKGKFKKQIEDYLIAVEHHVLTVKMSIKKTLNKSKRNITTKNL